MRNLGSALFLAVFMVAVSARGANAAAYWSSNGGSCVVDADNIQADDYDVNSGSIQHTSGSTALMLIYCGISYNQGATNPDTLHLSFDHSVTTDSSNHVTANLFRKTISCGTLTEIGDVGGSGWSSGFDNITNTFTHTFDFTTYFYYMRVDVDRSSTGTTMTFRGIALES